MFELADMLSQGFGVDPKSELQRDFFADCVIDEKFYYNGFIKSILGKIFEGVEDSTR